MLPCRREHVSHKIRLSSWGPKKDPKMTPKSTPKRAQEAPRWPKMTFKTGAGFSIKFRLHVGQFWEPKWVPKWTPKSLKNRLRRPRAAQRPPGSHLGAILEPFGTHFGPIFHQAVENTVRNHWSKGLSKTVENTVRNHSSKGLSKPLQARDAEGHGSVAGLGRACAHWIRPPSIT